MSLSQSFLDSFERELTSEASHAAYRRLSGYDGILPTAMDTKALFNAILRASCDVHPPLVAAIRRLRAAGFRTAALTNDFTVSPGFLTPQEVERLQEAQALLRQDGLFHAFISSAATGSRKPERRIYDVACQALGVVQPGTILFCDDIGRNLKAAKGLGWQTFLVKDKGTDELIELLERLTTRGRARL